jgi:predicted nucleic acid-binding protein
MRYLLDTNIVSDLIDNPRGRICERVRQLGEAHVSASVIVTAELRYGSEQRGQLIGGNDLLIAAQAVALGYTRER